jgi:hypothetical protein
MTKKDGMFLPTGLRPGWCDSQSGCLTTGGGP